LLFKDVSIALDKNSILSQIHLPYLLSNVLLVYQVSATHTLGQSCLLPPILEHQSFSEAHFHPLTQVRPLLLHTHSGAPFTSSHTYGLNLTLYTSLDCQVTYLRLRVDWWGTIGRAGARYWAAVPAWAVGIVTLLTFTAVSQYERGGRKPVSYRPSPTKTDSYYKLRCRVYRKRSSFSHGKLFPDSWELHLSYHSFHCPRTTSLAMKARLSSRC
jgi:hypothetical protein